MLATIIVLWLLGTYGLWSLFETSCVCDPTENRLFAFIVVSLWPLVVPIVMVQDLWDWMQEWRNVRV